MEIVYQKPSSIPDYAQGFCPGCGHGIVHKLVAEAIEKHKLPGETLAAYPCGCGILAVMGEEPWFKGANWIGCAHGRASAAAVAMKRIKPDSLVYAYQGDGDLASIGMCETIHTANRGTPITIIFINNTAFGMTGGQMAPTTMLGQFSTTTQNGRNALQHGDNFKMCELISQLNGPKYVARVAVYDIKSVMNARKVINRAFEVQAKHNGYSFVEIVSQCPTNWKMKMDKIPQYMEDTVLKEYPLGIVKDEFKEE